MKVTKAQVLKALCEEPLWGGHWITPGGSTEEGWDLTCSVCALGAVIRQVVRPPDWRTLESIALDLTEGEPIDANLIDPLRKAARLVARGFPWNGLSVAFEALWWPRRHQEDATEAPEADESVRAEIIAWVEEHFPEEAEI